MDNKFQPDIELHMIYRVHLDKAEATNNIGLILHWSRKYYFDIMQMMQQRKIYGIFLKLTEIKILQCKDDMSKIATARDRHYALINRLPGAYNISNKICILQEIIDNIIGLHKLSYAKESFYSDANLSLFYIRSGKAKALLNKQKENHAKQKYISEKVNNFFSSPNLSLRYGKITLKEMRNLLNRDCISSKCEREDAEFTSVIEECCVGIFTNINSVKHLPVVLTEDFAKINEIIPIRYNINTSFSQWSSLLSFIKSDNALQVLTGALRKQRKTNHNLVYLCAAIRLQSAVQFLNIRRTCTAANIYRTLILPRFYSYIVHFLHLFAQKILLKTRYTTMTDIMHVFPESISANISSFITNPLLPKEINAILYY